MASSSGGRKKRLVSSLDGEVLERLSMKLNPRMLMKDYQSLAGRLKYTYEYIRNFARERDPTLTLLQHWWSSKRGKEKTVSVLIEHLSDMERDDAVDLLRPYEYYSSHEAAEYDESFERPMGYAVAGGVNRDPGFPGRENEHHQQAIEPGACKPDLHRYLWKPEQNQRANFNGSYMLQNRKVANSVPNAIKDSFQSDISTPSEVLQEPVGKNLQFAYHDTSSRLDGDNVGSFSFNTFNKELDYSDGFCGTRRDIQVPGVQRPWTLDGSSASSVDGEYYCQISSSPQRLFKHGPVMRDYHDPRRYSGQFREGIDPRYIQSDYGGLAAAEGHTLTAAADKVALVIGNQNYAHSKLKGLQYPEQDATDVATALTQLNFKVVSLVNLTLSEMRTAMLAFCCLLGKGVYGVVYYAGHGYEDNGENFLLPVDSDLKYNREDSLRTQEILETMQQCDTSLNLLIIDACRVSLPNKSGITVPRIKRSVKGNNIFAYSCCSLQESLEEPNCRNGMYCSHLLRRLRENRRVENMLMDVASDFARTYNLKQRPCLETDSMMDFRLTDPIHPEFLPEEFKERLRRWNEAKRYPGQFSVENSDLQVFFEFQAPFSNVLCVFVSVVKKTQMPLAELYLSLQTHDPLRCVEKECVEMQSNPSDKLMSRQTFEITNIQKMYKSQESLMLSVDAMYKVSGKLARYEKTVDLSWPLVSNIICLWDSWLLGDRCKSTAV